MNFQSYSQVGQDCFAWGLNGGRQGRFLDIGCGHPTAYNNTYGLELAGWSGVCVDIHREPAWDSPIRSAILIIGDATNPQTFKSVQNQLFDYISVDCDEMSLLALQAAFSMDVYARSITIEHDRYRIGESLREAQRSFLRIKLFDLARGNVLWEGKPFEDWWIKAES